MPRLLTKNSGKKHLKDLSSEEIFDFTSSGSFKRFDSKVISQLKKVKDKILIVDYIYPLKNINSKTVEIADHVNLSGFNPLKGAEFIPLANIYQFKNGIVIAGLKEGTHPNNIEKNVLLKCNVKAYCYNIVPTAIYATFLGLKIEALGRVKDIHI